MTFYVSVKAIEELNTCKTTKILDENGNETGGYISIIRYGPVIRNIFGCSETIRLDKLHYKLDGIRGWFTTHDCEQIIDFKFFHDGDRITKWTYKGGY